MRLDKTKYRILVIEDNPGDYLLIDEYLHEYISEPELRHVQTYSQAETLLGQTQDLFDLILLDLSLPDIGKDQLLHVAQQVSQTVPVIILTGYPDMDFASNSLSMGVSDYLVKDKITALILYKSIIYALQRDKFLHSLRASQKRYMELFHLSPAPMWVYNLETLDFLDVNDAAIHHYGYSEAEFLSMSLRNIRPAEDMVFLEQAMTKMKETSNQRYKNIYRHIKKDGSIIKVEIIGNKIDFNGVPAEIVMATDITEKLVQLQAIENQNKNLKEIAWMQSHVLRAPVARIMGIIQLMQDDEMDHLEKESLLKEVYQSATEIDSVIKNIVDKSQAIRC
ncbi:PAS domain S-box protein [Dyadobacter tibetensis]|uniref:PAS domain S-box protein n=1 Tax=Dyadobacter tibetensis TaxID=1211851 RepID=UPI00046EBA1B|nr:PAS domain S-box protein [Dyadobacter tibetensis]